MSACLTVYPKIADLRPWKKLGKFGNSGIWHFFDLSYTPQLHRKFAVCLKDFRQTHINSAVHHGHCASCQEKTQASALALRCAKSFSDSLYFDSFPSLTVPTSAVHLVGSLTFKLSSHIHDFPISSHKCWLLYQYVPHKAVAEVWQIANYRKLVAVNMDRRANPLLDRQVVGGCTV